MKSIIEMYRANPVFALIVNCVAFFAWAVTLIFMVVVLVVIFTN